MPKPVLGEVDEHVARVGGDLAADVEDDVGPVGRGQQAGRPVVDQHDGVVAGGVGAVREVRVDLAGEGDGGIEAVEVVVGVLTLGRRHDRLGPGGAVGGGATGGLVPADGVVRDRAGRPRSSRGRTRGRTSARWGTGSTSPPPPGRPARPRRPPTRSGESPAAGADGLCLPAFRRPEPSTVRPLVRSLEAVASGEGVGGAACAVATPITAVRAATATTAGIRLIWVPFGAAGRVRRTAQ